MDAVSKEFVKGAEEYKNRFYFTNGNWENQCTTVILNGSTSNLTYDAIGNPLNYRDGMTMTWQNGRQLKSIVKGDTTLEFTYDINGQRQSKVEKKNGTTVHTTKYYYDGTKLAAENKDGTIVWYDYDENGAPIGMRVNGQDYIFRRNLQGDIVKIFNSDNDPVVGYNYQNAWGGGVEVTGPPGEVERLEHMISTVRKFDVMFFCGLVVPYNPFLRNLCFVNNYIHCFPVSGNGKEEIRGYGKFPVQG